MTHGMCCGGASSMRMLANAKQQKAEETQKEKDALKQEKASANKFQDKLKQFSGSFSFKSKQEPKA